MVNLISLIEMFQEHGVRYIVVGGVAINLHGVERATADLDVVVDFGPKNLKEFIKVMKLLHYRPRLQVKGEDFADPKKRKKWIKEKGMMVFSFCSKDNPLDIIDVFVEHPIPYDDMNLRKKSIKVGRFAIPIASIDDIIFMKKKAGRKQDLDDVKALRRIQKLLKTKRIK